MCFSSNDQTCFTQSDATANATDAGLRSQTVPHPVRSMYALMLTYCLAGDCISARFPICLTVDDHLHTNGNRQQRGHNDITTRKET